MADNKIQVLLTVDDQGTASLQKFQRTVAQTGKDGERAFSAMSASSRTLARGVASLAASYASLQGVRALISIADQYTQLEGRLRLVTTSTAELAAVETQLYAVAQQTRVGYAETVELYTRLARATKDTGISQTELMSTVQAVNQALIVSGATTTEANAALIQFSQGMASGVLRGEELNSVMEQTPRIAQMIADGLGISLGQLRAWGKEGKLTSDVVMPALLRSAEDVNREFGLMPTTVAQAGTVLANTLKSLVADANSGSGATAELAAAIIGASTAVDANREELVAMFADMATGAINAAREAGKLVPVISSIYSASSQLLGLNAGEWGIIGFALLRGGPQAAALAGALLIINGALDELGLGLKSLGAAWKGYAESMQNMGDVLSGKRDAGTGAWIDQQSVKIGDLETKLANLQQQAADTGETFTTGFEVSLGGSSAATDKLNAEIAETQAQLDIAIGVSASFQKGIKSASVDVNDMARYTGELSLETGNLSGEMGTLTPKVGAAGKAVDGAAKSKDTLAKSSTTAAKAAKDLAAEQKRLADEAERTGRAEIEAAVKTREATAELSKALFDTGAAYDTLGITSRKAYEDQVQAATDAYERILSIEDLTDSERARLREGLQKTLIELEDDYRGKVDETAGAITQIWTDLTDETKEVLHDWVENAIKMEFDSVGEAFESLAKAMLDVWIDMIAKMIAEWVGSGLLGLFTGQGLGGFGAAGGSLIGKGFEKLFGGGTVGTLADWGLTAAGTSSVIGGASSLLGGGAGSAAFDWGLNSFGVPALGGGAAATGAATLFGEQAAAGFTASLDTAMAGGLEWAAIPGKEFFGTGASGAAGGGAGAGIGALGATAGALALWGATAWGINKLANHPSQPAVQWDQLNNYGAWGRDQGSFRSDQRPGWEISGSGDAEMQSWGTIDSTASHYGFDVLEGEILSFVDAAKQSLADLTDSMGQQWADLAAGLEDSVPAYDTYLDAIMGVDVAMEQSADIHRLAQQAAADNGASLVHLTNALKAMGMSDEMARASAVALVAAVDQQQAASVSAASAAQSMASAVADFSNTPLNIRVNVGVREQPYRIDNSNPYAEHAVGGIFKSATLIPSIRGTRHLVGEAGSEAIMPLHAGPGTLKKMHDDIKALAARPVTTIINLDGQQIARATLPFVDAHVAAKATRGQLNHRTVY